MTINRWKETCFANASDKEINYFYLDTDDYAKGFLVNQTLIALKDNLLNSDQLNMSLKEKIAILNSFLSDIFNPKVLIDLKTKKDFTEFLDSKIVDISKEEYEIGISEIPNWDSQSNSSLSEEEKSIRKKMKKIQKNEEIFNIIYFQDKKHNVYGKTIGHYLDKLNSFLLEKIQINSEEIITKSFLKKRSISSNKSNTHNFINNLIEEIRNDVHENLSRPVSNDGSRTHKTSSYVNGYKKTLELKDILLAYNDFLYDNQVTFYYDPTLMETTYFDPFKSFMSTSPISVINEIIDPETGKKYKISQKSKSIKLNTVIKVNEEISENTKDILNKLFSNIIEEPKKYNAIQNLINATMSTTKLISGINNVKDLLQDERSFKHINDDFIKELLFSYAINLKKLQTKYGYVRKITEESVKSLTISYLDFDLEDINDLLIKLEPMGENVANIIEIINNKDKDNKEAVDLIDNFQIKSINEDNIGEEKLIEINKYLEILKHQINGTLTEKELEDYGITTPLSEFKNSNTILTEFSIKDVFGQDVLLNADNFNIYKDFEKIAKDMELSEQNLFKKIDKEDIKTKHTIYHNPLNPNNEIINGKSSSVIKREMIKYMLSKNYPAVNFYTGTAGTGKTKDAIETFTIFGENPIVVQVTDFIDISNTLIKGTQNLDSSKKFDRNPAFIIEKLLNGEKVEIILDEFIEVLNKYAPYEAPTRFMNIFNLLLDPTATIKIDSPYLAKGSVTLAVADVMKFVVLDNNTISEYIKENYPNFFTRINLITDNTTFQWQNEDFLTKTVFNTFNMKLNQKMELGSNSRTEVGQFYLNVQNNYELIFPELQKLLEKEEAEELLSLMLEYETTQSIHTFKEITSKLSVLKDLGIPEVEHSVYFEKILTMIKIENNASYYEEFLKLQQSSEYKSADLDDRIIIEARWEDKKRLQNVLNFLEIPENEQELYLENNFTSLKQISNFVFNLVRNNKISEKMLIEKFGFENTASPDVIISRIENSLSSVFRKFEFDNLWILQKGILNESLNNLKNNSKEKIKEIENFPNINPLNSYIKNMSNTSLLNFSPMIAQMEYDIKDIYRNGKLITEKDFVTFEKNGEKILFSNNRLPNFDFIIENMGKNDVISFSNNLKADFEDIVHTITNIIYKINNQIKDPEVIEYENINLLTYRHIGRIVEQVISATAETNKINIDKIVKSVLTDIQLEEHGTEIEDAINMAEDKKPHSNVGTSILSGQGY